LILAFALALPLGTTAFPAPAASVSDRLPDLGMARLKDFGLEKTRDGRRLLRFSSVVVNTGEGPFELHGNRPIESDEMTTVQRVFDDSGGYSEVPTDAVMYYGRDGHNHWHVWDLESFTLKRLDSNRKVGTGAKHGFCFFDNRPFGSAALPVYEGCGVEADLDVEMGLSPGWGDLYHYTLPDQYVDVTGLPAGRYRLTGIADEDHWFQEGDETNNATWVKLRIERRDVRVLAQGPGAKPIN